MFSGKKDIRFIVIEYLEYLKIKIETFSFRCKLYDLNITYTQSNHWSGNARV